VKVSRLHARVLFFSLSLSHFLSLSVIFGSQSCSRGIRTIKKFSRKIGKLVGNEFSSSRVDSKLLLVGDSADWLVESWRVFINMIIIQYVYDASR